MHPWDSVLLILEGSGVPCMPYPSPEESSNPHYADRIVRPRLDGEGLARANALESVVGIVAVSRIARDHGHLQPSVRRRLLDAAGGRRIERQQNTVAVECFQRLRAFVDLYAHGLARLRAGGDVGN